MRIFALIFLFFSCSHIGLDHRLKDAAIREPASWHSCFELLDGLVHRSTPVYSSQKSTIESAQNLVELEEAYAYQSFFNLQQGLSNQQIKANNQAVLSLLNKEKITQGRGNKATQIHFDQAQELYQDMIQTPCVRNDSPYQRPGVALGYCFGRAIVAHFHALRRGVDPRSMKKIWVVGKMRGDWGHHVAFMVKGQDNDWYVIDNVTGMVTHDEWIERLKGFQLPGKDIMFFVTEAARFGPDFDRTYHTVDLFNVSGNQWQQYNKQDDFYKGFFHDFFDWLDKQPTPQPFARDQ